MANPFKERQIQLSASTQIKPTAQGAPVEKPVSPKRRVAKTAAPAARGESTPLAKAPVGDGAGSGGAVLPPASPKETKTRQMNILITPSLLEAIEAAKAAGGYRSRNDAIASFLTDYLGSKGFIK